MADQSSFANALRTTQAKKEKDVKPKASILIVDDDTELCETLSHILEDEGYRVVVANNGAKAITEMKFHPFDFVLIDIMMPGMNGVETLRQIKSLNPAVATFLMTGHSTLEGLVSEALWAGVDGVLYKPFSADDVLKMIEENSRNSECSEAIDLRDYEPSPEALKLIPEEMARRHSVLPLEVHDNTLTVAMTNPKNLYVIEDLRARTGMQIQALPALYIDLQSAINRYYRSIDEIEKQIQQMEPVQAEKEEEARERTANLVAQTPIVRAVDLLVAQAVKDRASDIHIEPQKDRLRIRYRIDGILHDAMSLPLRVHGPLVSRIKVLSNMNIAERRRPQDGQFSIKVDNKEIDIRAATANTTWGEMVVLRILDKAMSVMDLSELGFLPESLEKYKRALRAPYGMILMSGPTGSGKTTTLYASINQLDHEEQKIITIEDPIEYRFNGICQTQVNPQARITFASGLRASMRLDPDVILVGEIRDEETAKTAIQAALTGHLVLSSVHANDSASAIFRLIDLGVEPFLLTSALTCIVAQRLVRRVCPRCKELRPASPEEIKAYEEEMGETRTKFFYGKGCNVCAHTGFKGRIGVFEVLIISENIRRMILGGANSEEIRRQAIREGMVTMRRDGMIKAQQGLTTPHEVIRRVFVLG